MELFCRSWSGLDISVCLIDLLVVYLMQNSFLSHPNVGQPSPGAHSCRRVTVFRPKHIVLTEILYILDPTAHEPDRFLNYDLLS